MRHHRGADDTQRDKEHARACQYFRGRHEAFDEISHDRLREEKLDADTGRNRQHKHGHQRFQPAVAEARQRQQHQHVECRNDGAKEERDAKEDLQRDGRAEELRQVHRDDAQLGGHPEELAHGRRITLPAGLREIKAGRDIETHAKMLEQNRHQVRQQDDPEERVTELRATGEVSGPVTWIHIPDRDKETGPDEAEETTKSTEARGRAGLGRFICPHHH